MVHEPQINHTEFCAMYPAHCLLTCFDVKVLGACIVGSCRKVFQSISRSSLSPKLFYRHLDVSFQRQCSFSPHSDKPEIWYLVFFMSAIFLVTDTS